MCRVLTEFKGIVSRDFLGLQINLVQAPASALFFI